MKLVFDASQLQQEVIAHHALNLGELVMLPGERAFILDQVKKRSPGSKVISAHLDVENGRWEVTVSS